MMSVIAMSIDPMAHNPNVSNLGPDPPKTLKEAEQRFRGFLRRQNYPETIYWLIPDEIVISAGPHYWIRKRRTQATQHAALRYAEGVDRNLGILLKAICATDTETFASVFIPQNDEEAQNHLMGRCLKLSCAVERHPATAITDPLRWLWLEWRYGKQSRALDELW